MGESPAQGAESVVLEASVHRAHRSSSLSTSGYLSYALLSGMGMVLPGISLFLLGLFLSTDQYGALVVLATLNSLVLVGSDSGLNVTSTILASRRAEGRRTDILAGGVAARCVLWAAATVLGLCALPFITGASPMPALWTGAALACVGALVASVSAGLRVGIRVSNPMLEARLSLAEKVVTAIAIFAAVALTQAPMAYCLAVVAAPLLAGLWVRPMRQMAALLLRSLQRGRVVVLARTQVLATMPVAVGIYATTLYWRLDVLLISGILGAAAAGSYAIAYYPIMALANLPGAGSVLMLRHSGGMEDSFARRVMTNASIGVVLAVATMTVGAAIFRAIPIDSITDASVSVLRIAALGLPALFINPLLAMRLRSMDRMWWVTLLTLGALVLNVGLNVCLLSSNGILIAAWSSNATEYFLLVAMATTFVSIRRGRTVS